MRRRQFIALVGGAAAWPLMAHAQQPLVPVVGVLKGVSAAQWTERMAGFHRGLGEAGYVEVHSQELECVLIDTLVSAVGGKADIQLRRENVSE